MGLLGLGLGFGNGLLLYIIAALLLCRILYAVYQHYKPDMKNRKNK